jgi:hypothetical protein
MSSVVVDTDVISFLFKDHPIGLAMTWIWLLALW